MLEIIIIDSINACKTIAAVQAIVYHTRITRAWHFVYNDGVAIAKIRWIDD